MRAWYSKVRDTELIDGSIRADYVVTFETDNFELKRKVEKYLQGIIDEVKQTEPNSSEKLNNCEHITEDGVTCAKYPACDDCSDNPLNKVKGSERLVKDKDEPQKKDVEWVYNKRERLWYPYSNGELLFKTEPQTNIHDFTDCNFCKDRNCKDCEGGKDESQIERSKK